MLDTTVTTGKTDTQDNSATAQDSSMSTPHASKAAAVLQIDAAELTALSTNPKKKQLFHPKMLDLLYELLEKKPTAPPAPVVPEISVQQDL